MVVGAWGQDAKPPVLLVEDKDGESSPLRVEEVEVSVIVTGNIAETVMTMRFRNDTDRVLEGELVFPLGEGRTVSRYALEVNGKMREGVAIPKHRGRRLFESVVRKEVDPGLLEWTKGNNFRTRIYPIPAKGFKSVRVGYEEELGEVDGLSIYRLPLDFSEAVGTFRMRMEIEDTRMAADDIQVEGVNLQRRKARTVVMDAEEKNFVADKAVVVKLRQKAEPTVSVEELGGELYFHVVDRPTVPAIPGARAKPRSVRLVWDASNSGEKRDVLRELAVLDRYFAWVGEATVELMWLRNDLVQAGRFMVRGGQWGELRKLLEEVRYDGGTRLGLLDFREPGTDAVVLVTDGISTIGKPEVAVGTVPVTVLHASQSAEHGILRGVAERSGGVYVNAAEVQEEQAGKMMTEQVFSLTKVTVEGEGELTEVYPSGVRAVNGVVGVAGKLAAKGPVTLVLHYGGGGSESVSRVRVDVAGAPRSGRVSRIWAQIKLRDLEVEAERNREAIVTLAKAQGLVTRFTSLIVLDDIEDYVEHRIVPPEPELREDYEKLLKEAPDPDLGDPEHLVEILEMWKKRCAWHEKNFPGLDEALFLQVDKAAKEVDEMFESLKDLTKEEVEEMTPEEKVSLAPVRKALLEFVVMKGELTKLRTVPKGERGESWQEALTKAGERFGVVMGTLEQGMGSFLAPGLPNSIGGGGGSDPFSAPSEEGAPSAPPAPSPAVSVDPFGGEDAGESDARNGGDYEPPELPNSVASGGDASIFPVTPATPTGRNVSELEGEIELAGWDPKTPYLAALKKVQAGEDLEGAYFEWKAKSGDSSAFYLDVADFFLAQKEERLALRILTNVAEMDLENVPLLRILGHRLDQLGQLELAELVFREVKDLREDEPQSWRDLALVLEKRKKYQEALDLLWSTVTQEWDDRFPGIQLIALMELNALVARQGKSLALSAVDERFLRNLDCDVRIVLTWDADATDMDLWVTGPDGERCSYENQETMTGGLMSEDFTDGYGPEEYVIRKALTGKYRVNVNYYGNEQQVLAGDTTVQALLITDWGRPTEKREAVTLRLKDEEEIVKVGALEFGK